METRENGNRETSLRIPATGIIRLEGMKFKAYHGCFEEEKTQGNQFLVDVKIEAALSRSIESDELEDTVDVQKVYQLVAKEMAIPSNLIEHAAGRILQSLASLDGVKSVEVKLSKCNPPLAGPCEKSSVTLSL
ncbi:MAG: dihydroneopterin aldolase [Bacteroidales bacterium]|nr:dihydroneopterin aldolase [Bacteroidales bacterium]